MTSTRGRASELSSISQEPSRAARTITSGATGCTIGALPKARPGLGSSRRISASMSEGLRRRRRRSCARPAKSRLATSGRLATIACMAGSKRSSSRNCSARHSARSRAPMPVGSKVWTTAMTFSTRSRRGAETVGDLLGAFAQIAGLVDGIDHRQADHALDRIVGRQRQLLRRDSRKDVGLTGDIGFDIRPLRPIEFAAADAGPGGVGQARAPPACSARPPRLRSRSPSKAFSTSVPRLSASPSDETESCGELQSASPGSPENSAEASASGAAAAASMPVGVGSGPSSARSSSGLRSSSSSTKAASSMLEYCSSLIACSNCGVMTRDWPCRSSIFADSAIRNPQTGKGGAAAPASTPRVNRPVSCIHHFRRVGHEKTTSAKQTKTAQLTSSKPLLQNDFSVLARCLAGHIRKSSPR